MRHPFERIPGEHRRVVMITLLTCTFAVMAALAFLDSSLRAPATPIGVVSFELCAWDGSCAEDVAAYAGVRLQAGASIGLDYLFLLLYASSIAALLVFTAARRGARARSIAALLGWAVFLAAALDAVENAALYAMLADGATPALAWTATGCASVKLVLLAIAILASILVPALARREA